MASLRAGSAGAPRWRNRDFVLLQSGQLLSTAGSQSTTIAYTLLTLALTQSPAKAGIVTLARVLPSAVFGVFGGIVADRFNRKRIMIAADLVAGSAIGRAPRRRRRRW